jgi:septation ring formation regulator EzrA
MKCSVDVVEFLMGHEGYLAGSYVRLTKTQIKESYVKGSQVLHIFGDADVSEIREELETTVKTLAETRTNQEKSSMALSSIVLENTELRQQLAEMRAQLREHDDQLKSLLEIAGLAKKLLESEKKN